MGINFGKYTYKRIKLKAPNRPTLYSSNNADAVSRSMLGMTKDEIIDTVKENKLTLGRHFHKNAGHLRMIVGQALRGELLKGKPVFIRGNRIDYIRQRVEWPFGYQEHIYGKELRGLKEGDPVVCG